MKRIIAIFLCVGMWLAAAPSQAALQVLACEPEWAALVRELAGDKAQVGSATTAGQDPHHIEARPSLIARARNADMVVCTGAELEVGWLPLLLRESGNARIQPGRPGHFEAARHATLIEVPAQLDRAQGDVHAAGNPHLHLDPRNIAAVADALAARLAQLDGANVAHYASRNRDFQSRWQAAIQRWQAIGARLKGAPVVVHHRNWSYLLHWLDMRAVADLEPKPGIEPSVAHLGTVLARVRAEPAKMVLHTNFQSPRASRWLAERAGMPVVELPATVGASEAAHDLFALYDDMLARLLGALK
jgi:zinc/manganese transport system substrate-binding protein